MRHLTFDTNPWPTPRGWGRALARCLPETIYRRPAGYSGSRKNAACAGSGRRLEIDPSSVTSPTFVLCQHHHGNVRCSIWTPIA